MHSLFIQARSLSYVRSASFELFFIFVLLWSVLIMGAQHCLMCIMWLLWWFHCLHGSARQVVIGDLRLLWESQNDPLHSSKTPQPTQTKLCTGNLESNTRSHAKFDDYRFEGVVSVALQSERENQFFLLFFLDRATAQTAEPIFIVDGSNDAVPPKVRPFLGYVDQISKPPKNLDNFCIS